MVALLVLFTVMAFLAVDYFLQRRRTAHAPAVAKSGTPPLVLHQPEYRAPQGIYFDPKHVWAFLEESGDAKVGVDDVMRVILGRIDRVDTVAEGSVVRKGDKLAELFHGERSVSVHSPFDGTVEAINNAALQKRNGDSLTGDWLCSIRPNDISVLQGTMMIGEKASDWLKRELRRLRVFLSTIGTDNPVLAETMHDGGMPYAGLVEYLSDEDWCKLRETFFDDDRSSC